MARATYMISLHAGQVAGIGIEGKFVQPETAVLYTTSETDADGPDRFEALLGGFFQQAEWEPRQAVVVMNTEDVRFRQIEFPFNSASKIKQALPFELGNLLLEPADELVYDFRILPSENGSAEVLVYLVPREDVERIVEICARHKIDVGRITFSAQALYQGISEDTPEGILIYAGSDEIFIASVAAKNLRALKSIPLHLGGSNLQGRGNSGDDPHATESAPATENPDPDSGSAAPDSSSGPVGLLAELELVKNEINRFIRTHSLGASGTTVLLKGQLAPYFCWQAGAGVVTLQTPARDWTAGDSGNLAGVIGELQENPRNLFSSRGINFFKRQYAWLTQIREMRGVIITLVLLLTLTLALAGTNFIFGIQKDTQKLAQLKTQAAAVVKQYFPRASSPAAGLREMQGRLRLLSKQRTLIAEFANYHYDALKLLKGLSAIYVSIPQLSVAGLKISTDRITLSGNTDTYQRAEGLKNRLGEMEQFKGKTITVTHQRSAQQITYRITIEL